MNPRKHWDRVYQTKKPDEVSWYRPHLDLSLKLIEEFAPGTAQSVIDVGGGESTLVDDLLVLGCRDVSVLDISATALDVARRRLGGRADEVHWLCGDVTSLPLAEHRYDVWHDRAVFHFLTAEQDRVAYVRQVAGAVKPGGHVIIAAFGPEGPTRCSGLEVIRYDADQLHAEFGRDFRLVAHLTELHHTPTGAPQQFVYCLCSVA